MIAIIDYKAGNLTSVKLALDSIGVEGVVTSDPEFIRRSPRVIFPGVGAAGAAMKTLNEAGLESCIRDVVMSGTPFLGICVGTQILLERSEEDGGVDCLGLIPGEVRLFRPEHDHEKVPQMGWNTVRLSRPHPLFAGIESESEFYFVHSYYPAPDSNCEQNRTHSPTRYRQTKDEVDLSAPYSSPSEGPSHGHAQAETSAPLPGSAPDNQHHRPPRNAPTKSESPHKYLEKVCHSSPRHEYTTPSRLHSMSSSPPLPPLHQGKSPEDFDV